MALGSSFLGSSAATGVACLTSFVGSGSLIALFVVRFSGAVSALLIFVLSELAILSLVELDSGIGDTVPFDVGCFEHKSTDLSVSFTAAAAAAVTGFASGIKFNGV